MRRPVAFFIYRFALTICTHLHLVEYFFSLCRRQYVVEVWQFPEYIFLSNHYLALFRCLFCKSNHFYHS